MGEAERRGRPDQELEIAGEKGAFEHATSLRLRLVPTVNYVRLEIIDEFQIQVKWIREGQRPVEAALKVDPG
jgi:hypothetical protein